MLQVIGLFSKDIDNWGHVSHKYNISISFELIDEYIKNVMFCECSSTFVDTYFNVHSKRERERECYNGFS